MSDVIICYGPPMRESYRESQGEKWCFVCRKRRDFHFIIWVPTEPSYYGPNYAVRCDVCKKSDADLFPGREREWEE